VTREGRLPFPARWLLRASQVEPHAHDEVQADLLELFEERVRVRGPVHAHWRLYRDVASLWLQPGEVLPGASRRPAFAFLRDASSDLRYAARLFARQPAILLLTILGLSVGLGIATAAFSLMNAAVLRGEGLVDPDRAPGILRAVERSVSTSWSYAEFLHLREGATRMQVEAVVTDGAVVRTIATDPETPPAVVAFVSGGFFGATGGQVIAGRSLTADDEPRTGPPAVVVSSVFWGTRLNRDPQAVGRTIHVGRTVATIVGVAGRGFTLPNNAQLWMPLTAYRGVYTAAAVTLTPDMPVQVFGRLAPDATPAEAEAQLGGVAASLPRDGSAGGPMVQVRLDSQEGLGRASSSQVLAIATFVFAVIGLVLLLACANVATVLVSTAITREREMAVRSAVGASRWRIVRQLMTESLALGTIAAAIGLAVASWGIPIIATMLEAPAGVDLAPDLNVYLFLGFVTLLTGIGAGLAPAWHGRGADLLTPLKGEGAHDNRLAPRRLRSLLVVTQAAVSVLLIVMASLFVRATVRAAAIDVGFDASGLYSVSAALDGTPGDQDAAISRFWSRAVSDLRAVPGVKAVALTEIPPFDYVIKTSLTSGGSVIYLNRTHAEYFDTLGLRLLTGRHYTRDEVAAKAPVALVSDSLARTYFGDASPLGRTVPSQIPFASARPVIIGVVSNAITARLHEGSSLAIYEPLDPSSEKFGRLLIRVEPGPAGVIDQARDRLRAIDPKADLRIMSVAARLQQEAGRPRMLAVLTGVVGVIAVVLSVIGLYGLTASLVGQRTREMGVRVAMGAAPRDLLRLLMWDSLRPVVAGLVLGTAAAMLASRVVRATMFFGVAPQDPVALAGAAAILFGAAMLAVLVPTRRAAAVDAAVVLRQS
jgi:predicted permease